MRADALPARIASGGLQRCAADWQLTPLRTRRWPDLDLWFLIAGRGEVQTPLGRLSLESGTCLILRGGEDYTFRQDASARFVHYWFHFNYLDTRGHAIPHGLIETPPLFRRFASTTFMSDLLDRTLAASRSPARDLRTADRWLNAALLEVARQDSAPSPGGRDSQVADQISSLCARVRTDPGKPHRVDEMAAELGYDPSYFCRLFKRHVGVSPREFVTAARMDIARFLLRDSNYSIGRISQRLGYQDVHFFSRHFRLVEGIPPTQYRQSGR